MLFTIHYKIATTVLEILNKAVDLLQCFLALLFSANLIVLQPSRFDTCKNLQLSMCRAVRLLTRKAAITSSNLAPSTQILLIFALVDGSHLRAPIIRSLKQFVSN